MRSRGEIRLATRAVRERWPLAAEQRARVVATLVGVLDDPVAPARLRLAAAKALVSVDAANLAWAQHAEGRTLNVQVTGLQVSASLAELQKLPPAQLLSLYQSTMSGEGGTPQGAGALTLDGGPVTLAATPDRLTNDSAATPRQCASPDAPPPSTA